MSGFRDQAGTTAADVGPGLDYASQSPGRFRKKEKDSQELQAKPYQ